MKKAVAMLGLLGSSYALPMEMETAAGKPDFSQSSDDKTEAISYEVVEKNEELGYEVREYPASKWFCTEWTQNTEEADPFADWEDSGVSPYEVMSSAAYEERPDSKHFMKLFKYILGVNKEGVEIDMTRPVTTKITVDEEAKEETHRMCFWSGSPWAEKDLPEPIDNSIEFEDRPKTHVYVRKFSGWAIADNEWEKEIEALEASLEKAEVTDADESHVYTVGYDGPWTKGEDRTNEIWVTKMTPEEGKKSAPLVEVEESTTERLPYESVMSNEEFELRKYPKSKWVCTKAENVDGAEDVLNGWQDTYDNNAMAAMAAKKRNYRKKEKETGKKDARHSMFKNLYQYISGVNSEYEEIDMTSPATIQHNVVEGSVENIEMCFWSGAEWNDKEMPEPIKKDVVYLVEKDEFYVYANRFGGYAMSYNDWHSKYDELKAALGETKHKEGEYLTAGYNSPWATENRRNEVWIPVDVNDIDEEYLNQAN